MIRLSNKIQGKVSSRLAVTLLLAFCMSLLSGCTKEETVESEDCTVLTLYTVDGPIACQLVSAFNSQHDDIRIELTEYADFNINGSNEGELKLATDMITGNTPDIIDLRKFPARQYAAKGILLDLFDFIDSDESISRDDFVENLLKVQQTGDKLYSLAPAYIISTVAARSDMVEGVDDWSFDAMYKTAEKQGVSVFGRSMTQAGFLRTTITFYSSSLVDWDSGKNKFDSDTFRSLLQLAASFPSKITEDDIISDNYSIINNKQLLSYRQIADIRGYQELAYIFGGKPAFVGFPDDVGGCGMEPMATFGICQNSSNPEVAWEFIRFAIKYYEEREEEIGFPITKQGTQNMIDTQITAMKEYEELNGKPMTGIIMSPERVRTAIPLSSADTLNDEIWQFISQVNRITMMDNAIYSIVADDASAYFDGYKTLDETVRLISSRINIYVAEQK